MPKHRFEHWTDGKGIGKKLTGPALSKRLGELKMQANNHHRKVNEHWRGMLDEARLAGEALLEAKRRLGHRAKWSKWRRENFLASKGTAINYTTVARHWDDERIREARAAGIEINSINKFLQVLRGQAPEQQPEKTEAEKQREGNREEIRKWFAEKLRQLSDEELELYSYPETFEELWGETQGQLKHGVMIVYGKHDNDETRKLRREVNKRIKTAAAQRKVNE